MNNKNDKNIIEKSVIEIMGLQKLPTPDQVEITMRLTELVQKKIMIRLVDILDDKTLSEFTSLLENKNAHKINQFIIDKVPNFAQLIEEEVYKVKSDIQGLKQKLDEKIEEK